MHNHRAGGSYNCARSAGKPLGVVVGVESLQVVIQLFVCSVSGVRYIVWLNNRLVTGLAALCLFCLASMLDAYFGFCWGVGGWFLSCWVAVVLVFSAKFWCLGVCRDASFWQITFSYYKFIIVNYRKSFTFFKNKKQLI